MKKSHLICAFTLSASVLVGCSQNSPSSSPTAPTTQGPSPTQSGERTPADRMPAPQPVKKIKKPLVLTTILRDSYGFPVYVTYDKSAALCKQRGGTLPSARDFAEYALANGARGVKETLYPNGAAKELENDEIKKMAGDEYEVIYHFEPSSSRIDFYFSRRGYKSSANPKDPSSAVRRFWTSDRAPLPSKPQAAIYYYTFIDGLGDIYPEPIDDISNVTLCIFK